MLVQERTDHYWGGSASWHRRRAPFQDGSHVKTESADERLAVSHRQWTEILGRCRFGIVKIAGKSYTALRIKAVAQRIAGYADADGSRVRPGIARVAGDLE